MNNTPHPSIADQVTQPPDEVIDLYETTIAFWPLNDSHPAYKETSAAVRAEANKNRAAEYLRMKQAKAAQQRTAYLTVLLVLLVIALILGMIYLPR